ncbi:MAG: hypothetical protein HQK76_13085 [Desulfobacterales bacterium]|nr:hypothetical protein [Desulfobacterales bacterium]
MNRLKRIEQDNRKIISLLCSGIFLIIWSLLSKNFEPTIYEGPLSFARKTIGGLIFLKLTAIMFFLIYKDILNKVYIVFAFAFIFIFIGSFFKFYSMINAFFSINFDAVSLLLGMGIISAVLEQTGFFDNIVYKIYEFSKDSHLRVFVLFCFISYIFSLVFNNLAVIIAIVPITLSMSVLMGFDPRPFIIAEIISSNIGASSTMIGDFPNMLISTQAGLGFNEFIVFMMPICMILFGVFLFYFDLNVLKSMPKINETDNKLLRMKLNLANQVKSDKPIKIVKPKINFREHTAINASILILFLIILILMLSKKIGLNPATVVLSGALSLLLFCGINKRQIVSKIYFDDILFFIGLFIIVGGIKASGLFQYISGIIMFISIGKPLVVALMIMWLSALFTYLMNSWVSILFIVPIVLNFNLITPHNIIWWALSLGILAGSISTSGNTNFRVSTILTEKFNSKYNLNIENIEDNGALFNKDFSKICRLLTFIFLFISTMYIIGFYILSSY